MACIDALVIMFRFTRHLEALESRTQIYLVYRWVFRSIVGVVVLYSIILLCF